MILPKKIIAKKEHGDILAIAKSTNLSRPTIINAFKGKKITRKTFAKIIDYYIIQHYKK